MRQHLEHWLTRLRTLENVSPHTLRAYEGDVRRFIDHLERIAGRPVPPEAVTLRRVRRYVGALSTLAGSGKHSPVSSQSKARCLSSLKSFFRWLVETGVLEGSPAEAVIPPKQEKLLPDSPSADELERIVEAAVRDDSRDEVTRARDTALLEVLYGAGLRVSEATGLDLRDLDLSRGWVRVTGKGGKHRDAPIGGPAAAALRFWLAKRGDWVVEESGEAVFLGRRGGRLNVRAAYEIIRERFAAAGVSRGAHPHALRHAFATHMLDRGADLLSIKELLGHESLSTTQIYTRVSRERLKQVYKDRHPRAGGG